MKLYKIPNINNYLIDKNGNVFSKITNKYIKPVNIGRGYILYILYENSRRKAYFRHKLLAITFIPNNDPKKTEIDHINGIPGDDRISNLRWVTHKENVNIWHSVQKRLKRLPVVVKFCKTEEIKTYDNHILAAKDLGIHRYEMLRRLHADFGTIFKDYTQVKYQNDKRDFPFVQDYIEERKRWMKEISMLGYNHITNEYRKFNKMKDVCEMLNISPSTLTVKINNKVCKIFPSGWEFKYWDDGTPWSSPSKEELERITNGGMDVRPITVKNIHTGEVLSFSTSKSATEYFGGTPTKIWWRLKHNNIIPTKDGWIFNYGITTK